MQVEEEVDAKQDQTLDEDGASRPAETHEERNLDAPDAAKQDRDNAAEAKSDLIHKSTTRGTGESDLAMGADPDTSGEVVVQPPQIGGHANTEGNAIASDPLNIQDEDITVNESPAIADDVRPEETDPAGGADASHSIEDEVKQAKVEATDREAEVLEESVVALLPDTDVKEKGEVNLVIPEALDLQAGFIEWEAVSLRLRGQKLQDLHCSHLQVCVTLYDWRTFPEQFANSRHPDEKHLYHLLVNEVGPKVIEALVVSPESCTSILDTGM